MENEVVQVAHTKFNAEIQSGYLCAVCGFQTVVMGEVPPTLCANDDSPQISLLWKQRIKTQTTIIPLPIK